MAALMKFNQGARHALFLGYVNKIRALTGTLDTPPFQEVGTRNNLMHIKLISSRSDKDRKQTRRNKIIYGSLIVGVSAVGSGAYFAYDRSKRQKAQKIIQKEDEEGVATRPIFTATKKVIYAEDTGDLKLTLFQFVTCPFCCKVRALLDYHGISYDIVEVNSITREETKWTTYKKVPILLIDGVGPKKFLQVNDSSVIMSVITSYLYDKTYPLEKIKKCYPALYQMKKPHPNKYFLMFHDNIDDGRTPDQRTEERQWRKWVDEVFVHLISPNVYRTLKESYRTFKWFSDAGDWENIFTDFQRKLVIYSGTVVMYFVGWKLMYKYSLSSDVRASLYEGADVWMNALKGRKFLGGSTPNLADLSLYGVLTSIEGTEAFQDMMTNTKIAPWFKRMQREVKEHNGALHR